MSLFRQYGESLLDQPIGIEESRVRQQKEGEAQGIFQNSQRDSRVARRAYRNAMRQNNPMQAMQALDWIDKRSDGNGLGSGISQSGVAMDGARHQPGNFMDRGLQTGGVSQPNSQPNSGPDGTSANLQDRLGLFSRMQTGMANGETPETYQNDAAALGIDARHFQFGVDRANQATGSSPIPNAHSQPATLFTQPQHSLDSPSFHSRLSAFGSGLSTATGNLIASFMNQNRATASQPDALTQQQAAYEQQNGTPAQQSAALTPSTGYNNLVTQYAGQFPGLKDTLNISDSDKAAAMSEGKAAGEKLRDSTIP